MRWVTYVSSRDGTERLGLVVGSAVHGLEAGTTLIGVLEAEGTSLAEAAETARSDPVETVELAQADLRAPIPQPPSIRDSSSFEAHVRAAYEAFDSPFPKAWYERPMFYFTNPHGIVGTGAEITAAPGSRKLDFELEVAAVVGRRGTNLDPLEAEDYIAGYCILNDWSARDIQEAEASLKVGPFKTKDWGMSCGPALVTVDELEARRKNRTYDLEMRAYVNGRQVSQGNLSDMYWSFGDLVAYASLGTWVVPGDLIASGTVGTGCILELALRHGPEAHRWLRPGDEVALEVDLLGRLVNRISPEARVEPLGTERR